MLAKLKANVSIVVNGVTSLMNVQARLGTRATTDPNSKLTKVVEEEAEAGVLVVETKEVEEGAEEVGTTCTAPIATRPTTLLTGAMN